MKNLLVSLFVLAGLIGCSDEPVKEELNLKISANEITPWPFSFDEAMIRCQYQPKAVIEANDKLYALNGANSSITPKTDFVRLTAETPEWLANPDIPGTKISLSDTLAKVNDTCSKAKK